MQKQSIYNLIFSFTLAFVLVITCAGVLSLAEKYWLANVYNPASVKTEIEYPVELPQVKIRTGYVGNFGAISLPSKSDRPEYNNLPLVKITKPFAAGPPALVNKYIARPFIRVGLYNTDSVVKLEVDGRSNIVTSDGVVQKSKVKKNRTIKIKYDKSTNLYTVTRGSWTLTTDKYIRIEPLKRNKSITLTNYSNPSSWNSEYNDNIFLGVIEVQYASATDKIWVVNELGIENYVKGIAEAGNENDEAYLKSLMTAARSYVYYHYLYPTKHADEPYLVDATANDQVYRGKNFSDRAPNVVAAVDETRGRIIHYEDEPVVTPYFSSSDGRTRSWSEVWGGEKPYLISVNDPGCEGEELYGHGVGLSALGARWFAEEKDWGWKRILKHYYTGVKLKRLWK